MNKTKARKTRKPGSASVKALPVKALKNDAAGDVKGGIGKLVDKSSAQLFLHCADGKH